MSTLSSSIPVEPRADDRQWRQDPPHPMPIPAPRGGRLCYQDVKDALDWMAALILFVLAVPLLAILGLVVKLTSRGPVLYSQLRLGKNGRSFRLYKIRTMAHNCEAVSGIRWSTPGDPRVTGLGRILRATHLDELPQLWNILCGDMSLIGPRPERPEIVADLETAIPHYRERLQVRPGVTGLAQVQLPPDTDLLSVRRKVACDLYYIRHLSGWLDLRILGCTVFHLLGLPSYRLCRLLLMPGENAITSFHSMLHLERARQG
jgi:lipopolysaccharide/colanic/teichoic acid biosynthesis glycosyltransferase